MQLLNLFLRLSFCYMPVAFALFSWPDLARHPKRGSACWPVFAQSLSGLDLCSKSVRSAGKQGHPVRASSSISLLVAFLFLVPSWLTPCTFIPSVLALRMLCSCFLLWWQSCSSIVWVSVNPANNFCCAYSTFFWKNNNERWKFSWKLPVWVLLILPYWIFE